MPEAQTYSVEGYPDRFLRCRILLHAWREDGMPWVEVVTEGGMETQIVYERLACMNCGMVRTDQRTMFGRLLRRNYRQPERYKLHREVERVTLAGERIRRLLSRVQRTA